MVFLLPLLFTSCLPDPLEVDDIPKVKPQIVVSSQIIPDQTLVVLLTKSVGALDASDSSDPEQLLQSIAIENAIVTIISPDATIDTLADLGNGAYGGVFIPFQVGASYELNIRTTDLGSAKARTTVMPLITFDEISADLFLNGFGDTLAQITHRFIDPDEKNYYMINVQEVEREDVLENALNPRAFTRLLDDADFPSGTYSEQFRVFPRDYEPGDSIAVTLSNISEDYFEFMQLRLDNRFSFIQFFSEPVNYPSNVEGGLGFFNLYVPDVRFFVFEE